MATSPLHAALPDTVWIGTAILSDGRMFTYKLHLDDSAGVLSGYSLMDLNGPQQTRAAVSGTLSGGQVLFRETSVQDSKYTGASGFCILQGSLKLRHFNGTPMLRGHFEGFLDNGKTVCANGKLMLVSPRDALRILSQAQAVLDSGSEKDPVVEKPVARRSAPTPSPAISQPQTDAPNDVPVAKKDTIVSTRIIYEAPPENVRAVMPGKTISVDCAPGPLTLDIWDNKDIDGDIVTLMDGNTALIKNLTLTGTHYSVALNLKPGEIRSLRLIAVSEGTEPLNTARIRITTAGASTFIDATSTIDKEVMIVLKGK